MMNSEEFSDLFEEITCDPTSIERYLNARRVEWFDMIMPTETLFDMINNDFVRGLEYYLTGYGEEYLKWTRGKVGPYEHIAVAATKKHWWVIAHSEDSSEGKLGKLGKGMCENKEELLEGFVNYCANRGGD